MKAMMEPIGTKQTDDSFDTFVPALCNVLSNCRGVYLFLDDSASMPVLAKLKESQVLRSQVCSLQAYALRCDTVEDHLSWHS